ncbi:hypothetical protein [Ferrovibrio terrae]|uniref:hypothetical protein n=1 Tax=Ferrovibrio terrae TaxID=2594003 RepID=UPI0031378C2A
METDAGQRMDASMRNEDKAHLESRAGDMVNMITRALGVAPRNISKATAKNYDYADKIALQHLVEVARAQQAEPVVDDAMVEKIARRIAPNNGDTSDIAWQHLTARGEHHQYINIVRDVLTAYAAPSAQAEPSDNDGYMETISGGGYFSPEPPAAVPGQVGDLRETVMAAIKGTIPRPGGYADYSDIVENIVRALQSATPEARAGEVSEADVERSSRALCADHYAKRFSKPIDDPHVQRNVENNWHIYAEQVRVVLQASSVRGAGAEEKWYRHKKRGTLYRVITDQATLQAVGTIPDETQMVVYRGQDGMMWTRPYVEFHDGRFERAAAPRTTGEV